MQWIKKHLPGGGGGGAGAGASTAAPVANSDTWMGSTGHHKGEKGSPELSAVDDNSEDAVRRREIGRSQSFAPPSQSAAEIARSQSMGSPMKGRGSGATPKFQPNMARADEGGDAGPDGEDDGADAAADANAPLEAREECLVTVPDAIVHLVDGEQSPHLATGHLSVVRIVQKGNGIVVLVRVGENLHWPLMQDTPTVKLDPSHYFFSLHIPASVEDANGDGQNEGEEMLNYGVTFQNPKKHAKELEQLDKLLVQYSSFSSPKLVQGDKQKEDLNQKTKELSLKEKEVVEGNNSGGKVVPKEVLSGNGKKVAVTEENQAVFWTTMAPNVDDYGSSAARAVATGSGHVIRGVFWIRNSTVSQLENGTIWMTSRINPREKGPSNISPRTLRNLRRVRKMSRATENVAKGVLFGIVTTAGFFEGSIIKSKLGKKVFTLMPGEVALVSLDAFGKLFDAVEKATSDVLESTSLMTQNVVAKKFGESAGQVTQETMATAGHIVATAWTVVKLREALNPKSGAKPLTKTGVVKGMAKNVLKGK